jgi:uncharacterized protein (DUF4415 family)
VSRDRKVLISIRLDADLIEYFDAKGGNRSEHIARALRRQIELEKLRAKRTEQKDTLK